MSMIEKIRSLVCLENYGDTPGWEGVVVAQDPGKKNPTRELVTRLIDALRSDDVVVVSSLLANNLYSDWREQRSISKSQYQMLNKFSDQQWIRFENLYGEQQSLNGYIDNLAGEQEEHSVGPIATRDVEFREVTSKINDLFVKFVVWCIDIDYFSGHIFFIGAESSLIFYPYYFENGLGIIALDDRGTKIAGDFYDQVALMGKYRKE